MPTSRDRPAPCARLWPETVFPPGFFHGYIKSMFAKYKTLIFSQACALLAIASAGLGFMRYQEMGTWRDDYASSFLFFAAALFAMEIKFIRDWLKTRKIHSEQ
jgi:hypothetical protein